MVVTIPVEEFSTKQIEQIHQGKLFYQHDGYRLGPLCMRIGTSQDSGAQGFLSLEGTHAFEVEWLGKGSGDDSRLGTIVPVHQLCVQLNTDSDTAADSQLSGNLFSAHGKSWIYTTQPAQGLAIQSLWIELFSGSVVFSKPENAALFSRWSLLSKSATGAETFLVAVAPRALKR